MAAIAVGLGNSSINTALPSIARDFHASAGGLSWITNGHLLGAIALAFPASRIADLVGRKRMLIAAAALFTVASVLSGLSQGLGMLVLAWSLQGVAAGVLAGASLAVLRAAFPADRMAAPLGVWGAAVGLGTGVGPVLSAELLTALGWRTALHMLAIPGLLVLVLGAVLVRESRGERRFPPIELLLPPALTGIALGISQSTSGWAHPLTLLPLLGGAALLGLYLGPARPPLHGLLRPPAVTAGAVLIGVSSFGSFALILYVSINLQSVQGMSPLSAFTSMLPLAVVSLLVAPLTGLLVQRVGARPPLALGAVLTGVAITGLALGGTGLLVAMAWMTLAGIGTAMVSVAGVTAMSAATPEPLAGVLGALYQTAVAAGGILGTALLSEILISQIKPNTSAELPPSVRNLITQNYLSALHTTLWAAAAVVLVSAIFATFAKPQPHFTPQ